MKKTLLFLSLSFAALSTSAQNYHYDINNDGVVNVTDVMVLINHITGKTIEPTIEPRHISFSVEEEPYIGPDGESKNIRKAPIITTESFYDLQQFYVDYTYFSQDEKGGMDEWVMCSPDIVCKWEPTLHTWVVGNTQYYGTGHWPTYAFGDDIVNFYAYANTDQGAFNCNGYNEADEKYDVSDPYVSFTADQSPSGQKDFLVSEQQEYYDHHQGHVYFLFKHACAAAQFSIIKSDKLISNNINVTVGDIILHNVKNKGEYHYKKDNRWQNVVFSGGSTPTNYTLWDASSPGTTPIMVADTAQILSTESTHKGKKADYFFIIPQTLVDWNKTTPIENLSSDYCYIELKNVQISQGNTTIKSFEHAYLPCGVDLKMGYIHHVVISVGTALRDASGNKLITSENGFTIN